MRQLLFIGGILPLLDHGAAGSLCAAPVSLLICTIKAVWSKRHLVGKLAKSSARLAVVLTFAAAAAALLPIPSWYPAVLAFVAGLLGVFSEIAARRKEGLEETFKTTAPQVDANLARKADGSFEVIIRPFNDVPFECDWRVVTRNVIIISGISVGPWVKVVPKPGTRVYRGAVQDMNLHRVQDGYVELRFRFHSIFADEYPELSLSGHIFHPYRLRASGELVPAEGETA